MTAPVTHIIELRGCTPEPLMSYLKALGVLRLIHEQKKDPDVRGWWENDSFRLRTRLSLDEILAFFLGEYKPTPIVGPWAGGSGFFSEDNKKAVQKAVQALADSTNPRVETYRAVIRQVHQILREEGVSDKPTNEKKAELIRRYRRELPDNVVSWMDAVFVLQADGQEPARLLGTGGNDGRLNFTLNFMQRIEKLVLARSVSDISQSEAWLKAALLGLPATLNDASVGQFAPGRAGGPNSTQGLEGNALDNPWDFVLMLEGALFFAGAAVRRYGTNSDGKSSFPFTVNGVSAGFDSASSIEDYDRNEIKEIWLPMWSKPAAVPELTQLFSEGRADVSGRPARDALDFARAVAGLGVDRGIDEFVRYGFLQRNGRSYLATPLGRWAVVRRTGVDLLREADSWLNTFRLAAKNKDAPPRYGAALRRIENAIFDFCKYGGQTFFQKVLIALGNAERELLHKVRFGSEKEKNYVLTPLSNLSFDWLEYADDRTSEFRLAKAVAFIYNEKIGPFRAHLEPVRWEPRENGSDYKGWAEKERHVVWTEVSLAVNMAKVLERRLIDGERNGVAGIPVHSNIVASLDDITQFLDNRLDDERIESLLWGICLVKHPARPESDQPRFEMPLPRDYALLKLLFLPGPITFTRDGNKQTWRLVQPGENGISIRPEPRILSLLCAGRIGEACALAAHRLRVSGLTPMPGPTADGRRRDEVWSEIFNPRRGIRLAAALLIPVSDASINQLVHLVCRPYTTDEWENKTVEMKGDNR